ncbi:MAG: tRNA 2-thiouridine(34) synthase MnmA [Candidatus Riflebacteria bacterium]|nr:tRNA 2-thiouridine(34) synthase MnmA [Candidatus Riflebacteria bacterium]
MGTSVFLSLDLLLQTQIDSELNQERNEFVRMSCVPPHTLVALSGGVDSCVTAALLLEAGHRVTAVTLKTFCYSDRPGGPKSCCGLEGIATARAAASQLGIQHFVFDVSERFKTEVVDDFVAEYAAGRTPNPCVRCNATVKIPDLWERAKRLGCNAIATGHYARVLALNESCQTSSNQDYGLFRGVDRAKDQAYFLWELPSLILPYLRLPLGDLTKTEVRQIARRMGLASAEKPESQEICFIPDGDYARFVADALPKDHPACIPGPVLDQTGHHLPDHQGFLEYTIGQRKGLGGGHGKRLYVTGIDAARRAVIVGEDADLYSTSLTIDRVNLLLSTPPEVGTQISVMIRHRAKALPGVITEVGDRWHIDLAEAARAVTPGQSAVIFVTTPSGDRLIAGGRILL